MRGKDYPWSHWSNIDSKAQPHLNETDTDIPNKRCDQRRCPHGGSQVCQDMLA
jgi:hypothetical protein